MKKFMLGLMFCLLIATFMTKGEVKAATGGFVSMISGETKNISLDKSKFKSTKFSWNVKCEEEMSKYVKLVPSKNTLSCKVKINSKANINYTHIYVTATNNKGQKKSFQISVSSNKYYELCQYLGENHRFALFEASDKTKTRVISLDGKLYSEGNSFSVGYYEYIKKNKSKLNSINIYISPSKKTCYFVFHKSGGNNNYYFLTSKEYKISSLKKIKKVKWIKVNEMGTYKKIKNSTQIKEANKILKDKMLVRAQKYYKSLFKTDYKINNINLKDFNIF